MLRLAFDAAHAPGAEVRRLRATPPVDAATLVRAAAAGDEGAAALVWDEHSALVRGLLRRALGPSADVEDLVQEVFLRFFKRVGTLRDPNALRSFIVGIALRVARGELRSRRVRRWLRLSDTGQLPEASVECDTIPRFALVRLYEVLDRLDDRARLVFVLRHVEGYELTEVASALGCSLATIKRYLARAQSRVLAAVRSDPLLSPYLQETPDA